MNLINQLKLSTDTSPIIFDFVPTPLSILLVRLKLNGYEIETKINIDINIIYRDSSLSSLDGRIFLLNSGTQSIYTSSDGRIYKLKFDIPEFKNNILSYISIAKDKQLKSNDKSPKDKQNLGNKQLKLSKQLKPIQESTDKEKIEQDIVIDCLEISSIDSSNKEKLLRRVISQKISQKDETQKEEKDMSSPHASMVVPNARPNARAPMWTLITTKTS